MVQKHSVIENHFVRNKAVEDDLALLAKAHNYRDWLFALVEPHLGQRVLEIGSGIGNYSNYLLEHERVWLSDYDSDYVAILEEKFGQYGHISCHNLDLASLDETLLAQMQTEKMDTVLLMNVLEHIDGDSEALRTLSKYLSHGGKIVIEVPALHSLYGSLDEVYGHYRRYNRQDVQRLLDETGLKLVTSQFYNMPAVLTWFWVARIKRQERLPVRSVRFFDQVMVPILRRFEHHLRPPLGSSMLIVLQRL